MKCSDLDNALRLAGFADDNDDDAPHATASSSAADADRMDDRGARYVRSLNYLDAYSSGRGGVGSTGDALVDNLSEWTPSNAACENDRHGRDDDVDDMAGDVDAPDFFGANDEMATAELAAKLGTAALEVGSSGASARS